MYKGNLIWSAIYVAMMLSLFAFAACESDSKYTSKLESVKHSYNLPTDAVMIREFGCGDERHNWVLFELYGDTILYHCVNTSDHIRESMTDVSMTSLLGDDVVEQAETPVEENAETDDFYN